MIFDILFFAPMTIHKPVLLGETVELLNLRPGITVVDATLGGGGHSRAMLKIIGSSGKLVAIDKDSEVIERHKLSSSLKKENVYLINDNFARLAKILDFLKIDKIDAVVADLGVSSDQLEDPMRGFSFLKNGPLDMRMDRKEKLTAAQVVNNYSRQCLEKILKDYSDEKFARSIAKNICRTRQKNPIQNTNDLVEIISNSVPLKYKTGKIHFATKVFQALRIEVNQELQNLEMFLKQAFDKLAKGGRIAVISFHSGEDRIIKNFFRENARGRVSDREKLIYGRLGNPRLKIITPKPVTPLDSEIANNPRSRSAKLRVAEKI